MGILLSRSAAAATVRMVILATIYAGLDAVRAPDEDVTVAVHRASEPPRNVTLRFL